ncbi:MAG: hypothetical protein FJ404_15840 [Verrucomicrobia bacterium]|nr:hypothetical protein [Verrucomicrobiota bacterium]
MKMKQKIKRSGCLSLALGLGLGSSVCAADESAAIAELQRQIQSLQKEVERLKASAAESTPSGRDGGEGGSGQENLLSKGWLKSKGLTFSFYGESKYRFPESGANSFDAHRYVLSPSYAINDWLVFNSEVEIEHGGVDESTGRGSRFNGELELEQFYVDILIHERFNLRSLGIDLVPVGRFNKYHEPTLFYSTERPELYREIIPTTWMEPSLGAFGKITEGLSYQVQVSTGLEDSSSSAAGAGITSAGGFRSARPRLRLADENQLAYSGRLHYRGVPGLDTSASMYFAQPQAAGGQHVNVALWDIEGLYRVPRTGLELRADFAYWHIDDPEKLLANQNASGMDDVGTRMYGWYVEAAYHLWPEAWRQGRGEHMDLVPFIRYSQVVTQSGLVGAGRESDDGTANKDFLTAGVSYFLNEHFVVKADWRRNFNGSTVSAGSAASQDYFQIGVGMFF